MSVKVEDDYKISKSSPFYGLIQDAYKVFSVPIPMDLEACNACCMPDDLQGEMKTFRSPDIPFHLVYEWFYAATNTPVSQNVWCYVLPRALEILAVGRLHVHSIEISFSKFPLGEKSHWNEAQWQILDDFQRLYLNSDLEITDKFSSWRPTLDDKICMFANGGWNTSELFEQIYNWPIKDLIEKLHKDWNMKGLPQIFITPFWSDEKRALEYWTSDKLQTILLDYAMDETSDKRMSDKAFELVDTIWAHGGIWKDR